MVVINIDEDVASPRLSPLGSTPESPIIQAGPYNLPTAQKPQLAEPVIIGLAYQSQASTQLPFLF